MPKSPSSVAATNHTGDSEERAAWKAAQRALRMGDPFNTWVIENSTRGTAINMGPSLAWTGWVTSAGAILTNASSTSSQIWRIWASTTGSATSLNLPFGVGTLGATVAHAHAAATGRQINARMSPEERALHEDYERRTFAAAAEQEAARKIAGEKAEVLLRSMLTAEQQHDLEHKRCFYLYSGGKKFRIDRGRTGNVKLVDDKDQVVESYCIHPQSDCPDADTMLAQKLLLETDRETFERVANISPFASGSRRRAGVGLARAQ